MDDEEVLTWLISMTTYIANEHHRLKHQGSGPGDNRGPRFYERNVHEAFDEGFARWMGFRGEEKQDEELHNKRQEDPEQTKHKPYRKPNTV